MDLQYDSPMHVLAVHARQETILCVLTHRIAFDMEKRRVCMARLIRLLEKRYPEDAALCGWRKIFEDVLSAYHPVQQTDPRQNNDVATIGNVPPEICIYSENRGPKLVFVHTGNTGSAAYYRLADRIRDQVSFAVIEPFNLYHPDDACHGIPQIAAKYIEILKRYQPEGPYLLGGWCYGGMVAHEIACQLEQAGETVRHLFMLDSHALGTRKLADLSVGMLEDINREYFETSPLFTDLREQGMLDAMVTNAAHVAEDMKNHVPSVYHGAVTYFRPSQIPAGASKKSRAYWRTMMQFDAGNYEHYCLPDKLCIVPTPHEHDLMMDDPSLDIIVPVILDTIAARED